MVGIKPRVSTVESAVIKCEECNKSVPIGLFYTHLKICMSNKSEEHLFIIVICFIFISVFIIISMLSYIYKLNNPC